MCHQVQNRWAAHQPMDKAGVRSERYEINKLSDNKLWFNDIHDKLGFSPQIFNLRIY
jgi:hypothetical protein